MKWEVSWPQHRGFTIEIADLMFVNGEVKVFDSEGDIPDELREDTRFPRWPAKFPLARVDHGYKSYPLTEDQYARALAKTGVTPAAEKPAKRKRKPRPPKPPGTGAKPDAPADPGPDKPHTGEDDG